MRFEIQLKAYPGRKKPKSGRRVHERRRWLARLELFLVLAGLLIFWFFFTPSEAWVERNYSRGFYFWLSSWYMPLTNALPFSLAASLLLLLPLAYLAMLIFTFKLRYFWRWFALSLWRTGLALMLVALLFVLSWGANYQRESIENQFVLQTPQVTELDLERLLSSLTNIIVESVNAERDEARAMASVVASLETTVASVIGQVPPLPEKVKRLPQGSLILLGRASGVMSPWTLEPHIDSALPSISYVAIGAHELAHVAGYAGEADADFISAIAGLNAEDPYARYAVALRFWQQAYWQLSQEKQASFLAQLPDSSRQDLNEMVAPYQKYQMPKFIQDLQARSYNSYLKSQGVEEGIKDYSRTIDLLIQAQKQGIFEGLVF